MTQKKETLQHQMYRKNITYIGDEKYTTETLVRVFEYFAHFRTVYIRLEENIEFPNVRTLTKVTSKKNQKTTDDNTFIKQMFTNLNDIRLETCVLLFD